MLSEMTSLPAGLLDTSMPTVCVLLMAEAETLLISASDTPERDMQRMVEEYRKVTDMGIYRNAQVRECRDALEALKLKNSKVLTEYCNNRGMKPDPATLGCTR